jgi:predicted kinase
MEKGISPIVVDNTNISYDEIKPCLKLANEFNYEVSYAEPDTAWKFDVDELTKRNSHGVPREVIQRMVDRWQPTETFNK